MRNVLLAALMLSACAHQALPNAPSRTPDVNVTSAKAEDAAASIDAFAKDLHAALPATGNLFYSPASIAIALGYAEQGAGGSTKAELDKALHLSRGPLAARELEAAISSARDPEIAVADRFYFDRSLSLEAQFAALAPTEQVDFQRDPEGARKSIDAWVSDRTHARIPELVPPGALGPDSRFVIANAVYFKAAWAHAFDPKATAEETFHGQDDETVSMMHARVSAGLGQHASAHVLDLPYRSAGGLRLSMTVVLPDSPASLGDVERTYESEGLAAFASAATQKSEVDVSLPRLKLSTALALKPALEAMGARTAFTDGADFHGMARATGLHIGEVLHEAFVDVNEEGTEAAAATGVIVAANAVMLVPQFRADHPFLFFVRDQATGLVLFAGRCVKP